MRGVFTTYLGWFGGDPSHLHPYTPLEYSQRLVRLSGGLLKLLNSAEISFEEEDPQWSLHCTQAILRYASSELFDFNEVSDSTILSRARQLLLASLRSLASREVSANGRNYFMTYANELEGKTVVQPGPKQVQEVVKQLGAIEILKLLPLRLKSELCEEVTMTVCPLSSPLAPLLRLLPRSPIGSQTSKERCLSWSHVAWLMFRKFLTLRSIPKTFKPPLLQTSW